MRLQPVAAGDAHELEALAVGLVAGGQLVAPALDVGHRALEQLGQQLGRDRLLGDEDHRLDRPQVVGVGAEQAGAVVVERRSGRWVVGSDRVGLLVHGRGHPS